MKYGPLMAHTPSGLTPLTADRLPNVFTDHTYNTFCKEKLSPSQILTMKENLKIRILNENKEET